MEDDTTVDIQDKEVVPDKKCLNCGADLQGAYCHVCGQEATNKVTTAWGLVIEYICNAFIWDHRFLPTVWNLIRRPGHLTKAFNAGRFVAYEHPLKLNMFILLVFITIFLFFSNIHKSSDPINDIARQELVRGHLSLDALKDDVNYSKKMKESVKDTIQLSALLSLSEEYPEIITKIDAVTDNGEGYMDTIVAVVPRVLIQDGILTKSGSDVYYFPTKNKIVDDMLELDNILKVWRSILDMTARYFPMIILLTAPFLAFAVKLLHLRRKQPFFSFFIFALHYTAFVELSLLFIYILHLMIHPGFEILELAITLASCIYLTIAVKNVYEGSTWVKSTIKALLISLIYQLICLIAIFIIFIIAIFSVVI